MLQERLQQAIANVPDFPKPGIVFKDITPIFLNANLTADVLNALCEPFLKNKPDAIAGIESRGFLFGLMMAQKLEIPFIPIRKKGKLPRKTHSVSYQLEYGSAEIEVHAADITPGQNIVIHDDLLATGGTAKAAKQLLENCGANVLSYSFLVELSFLKGCDLLNETPLFSLLKVD